MFSRGTLAVTVVLCLAAIPVFAQEAVSFDLRSPNGAVACQGETVVWEIWVRVTTANNAGLALACVDLVQDSANPAKMNIPVAAGVPAGMENFSRPAGISNPGEGGLDSGYVGVQRGVAGQMNLIQIGGGQNTFGVAGSSMGTNPNVVPNVGVSAEVLLASGSFVAPAATGTYTFRLANPIANVMTQANTPPNHSPVVGATASAVTGVLSFTVTVKGDLDGDGHVNLSDLAALLGNYGMTGVTCHEGDLDGDGSVNLSDLAALLGNYGL
jgi:hypothetical protein